MVSPEQSTAVSLAMKAPEADGGRWSLPRGGGAGVPLVIRGQQRHEGNALCLGRDPKVGEGGTWWGRVWRVGLNSAQ